MDNQRRLSLLRGYVVLCAIIVAVIGIGGFGLLALSGFVDLGWEGVWVATFCALPAFLSTHALLYIFETLIGLREQSPAAASRVRVVLLMALPAVLTGGVIAGWLFQEVPQTFVEYGPGAPWIMARCVVAMCLAILLVALLVVHLIATGYALTGRLEAFFWTSESERTDAFDENLMFDSTGDQADNVSTQATTDSPRPSRK